MPPKKKVPRTIKKIIKRGKIDDLVSVQIEDIEEISKKFAFLKAEDILAYFMNRSNKLNILIKEAETKNKKIITTDFCLYEAINSARGSVEIPLERLKKFLWNVTIIPQAKVQINRERMNEIRRAYGGY